MSEISIPGDPGGLSGLASQLDAAAGQVDAVQSRIAAHGLEGSWSGAAADAFSSTLDKLPGELSKVAHAFNDAGRALTVFSAKLSELQQKAAWYDRQIEGARQDMAAAEARHRDAETELQAARTRHDAAGDPASRHSAQSAVYAGESSVGEAAARIEETSGRIAGLERAGASLRDEYDSAVKACCGALDAARHAGSHSFLGAIAEHVKQMGEYAEHGAAAIWHGAKDLGEDLEGEVGDGLKMLDEGWESLRGDLSIASDGIGILSIGMLALAMFPPAHVVAVPALVALTVGAAVDSGAMFLGDGIEAMRGKREKDGTKYADFLPGDGFDLVLSLFPVGVAARGGKVVVEDSGRVVSVAAPIEKKVVDEAGRSPVFKRAADFVNRLPRAGRQGVKAIDSEVHYVMHHWVRSTIDKVVESPVPEYRSCTVPLATEPASAL